jgi:hypothetical protein
LSQSEVDVHAADQFFTYGSQYYISGPHATFAGLTPIVGNRFHHAVGMFLKGALCRTIDPRRNDTMVEQLPSTASRKDLNPELRD